jgi:hemerythrin
MKSHFEHEEKYMTSINYPESYDHTILHEKIIEEMNNFLKSISKMSIEEVERRLIEYIDIWLINHILYEDRKIIRKPIETKI